MSDSIYELESKLAQTRDNMQKMRSSVLLSVIIVLLRIPIIIFLIISLIYHWFINYSMTFMQVIRWSLSTFSVLYAYLIAAAIYRYFKADGMLNTYQNYQLQEKRLELKIKTIKKFNNEVN